MPRIRSIKPETTQSQSMGRLSREARLCFILLWTQADDAGRLRGNSRMLASILFPYDDDAPSLIDAWLAELVEQGSIRRYSDAGDDYIDIPKWLEHQKIDKPSRSKLPAFDEASRETAEHSTKPRESSSGDRDQGLDQGRDQGGEVARSLRGTRLPTNWKLPDEWKAEAVDKRKAHSLPVVDLNLEADKFRGYWTAKAGQQATKLDWRATWLNWILKAEAPRGQTKINGTAAPRISDETVWRTRLQAFKDKKFWPETWGSRPGNGCSAPLAVLAEFGLSP